MALRGEAVEQLLFISQETSSESCVKALLNMGMLGILEVEQLTN